MRVELKSTVDIDLDMLAQLFAGLDDDSQAQFFVKVAAAAEGYPSAQENQWWYVGRHLATCECSTEGGRDVIRSIYRAMEHKSSSDQL